jgi:1,2-dihydroxy-3-keto-5-methylthiopentene dioxygenase
MSRLIVYREGDTLSCELDTTDGTLIAAALHAIEVRFERWKASHPLSRETDDRGVMDAYGSDIERLKSAGGYRSVDVLRCLPDNPQRLELRRKFLQEHTHGEDEVRFFVEGAGVFYLRSAGKVYVTRCERGDLLSVPAGTRHWFDMGPAPFFTAIRWFTSPEGWVARFTGDRIAERFPAFENVPA